MCRQYHFLANTVESNTIDILEAINGLITPELYANVIVEKIGAIKTSVEWSEIHHVYRSSNGVAHIIAHGPEFIRLDILASILLILF